MINHDFASGASITHFVAGTGVFSGSAELGRATASVGAGNGGLKLVAEQLGAHMNGVVWQVKPEGSPAVVELDPTKVIRYAPLTGNTSGQSKDAFPALLNKARASRGAASALAYFEVAVGALGDGSDPAPAGSATMAGGVEPTLPFGTPLFSGVNVDGGLVVFDAPYPLVLVGVEVFLDASVAWDLRLAVLSTDRAVVGYSPVANATSQRALVTTPAVILPGSGISFVANTSGVLRVTVKRLHP